MPANHKTMNKIKGPVLKKWTIYFWEMSILNEMWVTFSKQDKIPVKIYKFLNKTQRDHINAII